MIKAASAPIPRYGDAEWHRLAETDRRRVAAVVLAAECWATESDEMALRLASEIATGRAEHELIETKEFAAMAAGVRHLASVPTYAELSDRRGEPDRAARARARSDAIRDGWNRAGGGDAA